MKRKIYITGDTHGNIDFFKFKMFLVNPPKKEDILIILGDAGIIWSEEGIKSSIELYSRLSCTVLFIDGNHENFSLLNTFPIVTLFNAKMHKISENIYHILRGEILKIDDITALCIGGAHSIDKMYRVVGISWWPEEDITNQDIKNALKNLEKVENKVDFIFTHCCDSISVVKGYHFKKDNSSEQLNFVDKIVKYKYWYFGHYHFDAWLTDKKLCIYQNIYELTKNGILQPKNHIRTY